MPLIDKKVYERTPKEVISWRILSYCLALSFAGAMHGVNTANISGVLAMEPFDSYFGLDGMSDSTLADWNGWFTSIVILGSCFGSLACPPFMDRLGRKYALIVFSVLFVASAVLMTANPGSTSGRIEFLIGRFLSGFGSGGASVITPGYIAEIAPQSIRGGLAASYNANTMLWIGLAYWINFGSFENISSSTNTQWLVPMAVQALPGIILIIGVLWLPESPRWLLSKGKVEEAHKSLERLRRLPRDHDFVRQEFNGIQSSLETQPSNAGALGSLKEMLGPAIRGRLFMVMVIQVAFQFSGGNTITYYNTSILQSIGLTSHSTNYLFSGIYGLVKFLSVLVYCLFLIDRIGRRKGLFIGSCMIIAALTYITVYLAIANPGASASSSPSASGYVALVAIYVFAVGYAFSWGVIPWIIVAEVFPTRIRSTCMAICVAWQYLVNFALSRAQPNMVIAMHPWGPFLLFTLVTTLMTICSFFAYPETKGLSMEYMDELFKMPWYKVGRSSYAVFEAQSRAQDAASEEKSTVKYTEDKDELEHSSKTV